MKLKLETLVEKYKEGEVYFTDLLNTHLNNIKNGLDSNLGGIISELLQLLNVLEIKIKYQDLGSDTEIALNRMLKIIGGNIDYNPDPQPTGSRVYYGVSNSSTPPTQSEILLMNSIEIESGLSYTIDFNNNSPLYSIIAEPITEPIKLQYQDILLQDNRGDIGSGEGPFSNTPIIVGSYRVYITTYKTIFINPITLKK